MKVQTKAEGGALPCSFRLAAALCAGSGNGLECWRCHTRGLPGRRLAMSTVPARPVAVPCLVLDNVDWRTYTRLLRIFAERRALRLTYDRGRLEIMSPLPEHEMDAEFLGRLVVALTEELGMPILSGGSTTFRRRRHQRGLEPDCCYWIANEPAIRGKRTLDLRIDPPPDLAIEVGVTSRPIDRMSIYAVLGVPQVWRLEDQTLTFNALGAKRKYSVVSHSLAFPLVTPADLLPFFALRANQDENSVVRQFRAWIQQRMGSGGAIPPVP
jgi:Uma2 family endonuclease